MVKFCNPEICLGREKLQLGCPQSRSLFVVSLLSGINSASMQTNSHPLPTPKWMIWTGFIMSLLPVLMLLTGAVMSILNPTAVGEAMGKMGYPATLAVTLGTVELLCTVLYLIPQTSILGAILLTGYLGGATATHVRVSEPFFLPILFGVLVWGGIYLRNPRLRALIPFRR